MFSTLQQLEGGYLHVPTLLELQYSVQPSNGCACLTKQHADESMLACHGMMAGMCSMKTTQLRLQLPQT
jgi:hypothetical protein